MSPAPERATTPPVELVADHDAPRLDRFLAVALPNLSRSRLKGLIEAGMVASVAGPVRDAAAMVRAGTHYYVSIPPPTPATPEAQNIALDIVYEDPALIVLVKPAGLVVHPAPGSPDGTLVNALLAHCGDDLPGIGGERRPGIVHRLDKDTSGLMVVAKTELAMARLSAAFAARDLDRAYVALCWGQPIPARGEIEGAIGRDRNDRKRMALVKAGGKPALTRYTTLHCWLGGVSLLSCRLATGRTHQIRVHLAARGHALVGDPVYLRRIPAAAKLMPAEVRGMLLDFPRQALHATTLGFRHPISGRDMSFEAPPPPDLHALIDALDHYAKT